MSDTEQKELTEEEKQPQRLPPLLSLIIPEYNADLNLLFQNLSVVNAQVNLNFMKLDVIVVDDASDDAHKIPLDFFRQFGNLTIQVVRCNQNGGPGVARQIGIDVSRARYVMFADADDCLYDINVISQVIAAIENQGQDGQFEPFDILSTDWSEEIRTARSELTTNGKTVLLPDEFAYTKHENDGTWMHGKVYRREFLTANAIRFDDLRVHEDRRFNAIAFALSHKTMRLPIISYLWKYRSDSITRAKGAAYSYNSIAESVDAADRAYSELIEKHPDVIDWKEFRSDELAKAHKINLSQGIVQTLCYTYLIVQSWVGRVPDPHALSTIESELGRFYLKYKDIYDAYPQTLRDSDYGNERNAVVRQMGPFVEKETLSVFLWRIAAASKAESAADKAKDAKDGRR